MRENQSLEDIFTFVNIILTQTCNKQPTDLNMVIVNTSIHPIIEMLVGITDVPLSMCRFVYKCFSQSPGRFFQYRWNYVVTSYLEHLPQCF